MHSKISRLIVFSSFEEKYQDTSLKSIAIENSFSKIYPFNLSYKSCKKFRISPDKDKLFKLKTNLLCIFGDKISFQLHAFVLLSFVKYMDKNLMSLISLLNGSRKNPYADLKLSSNCLSEILKNDSNRNLYFKEEYDLLKAEYFLQIRLLNLGFLILSKIFLFSRPKSEKSSLIDSTCRLFELLKVLINRLAFFNFKILIDAIKIDYKKLFLDINITRTPYLLECHDFPEENLENLFKVQINWIPNRHFIKKILRKKHFLSLLRFFKKIDNNGFIKSQKLFSENPYLFFDVIRMGLKNDITEKVISNETKIITDLILFKNNLTSSKIF